MNGHIFSNLNRAGDAEISASDKEKKDDEKNVVLTNEQIILLEDQRQELADLKRQVVFLQVSLANNLNFIHKLLLLPALLLLRFVLISKYLFNLICFS